MPTSTMSAPPLTTASMTEAEAAEVRVAPHHVGDEGALLLAPEPLEDRGDRAQSSNPAFFAMVWTSLSPLPERVTTMDWRPLHLLRELHRVGDRVSGLEGGDYPLLLRDQVEGLDGLLV